MTQRMLIKVVCLAAATAFSVGAYAQSNEGTTSASAAPAPTSKAENRALTKKVQRAFAKTRGLNPAHIYVKARDGAITLTGSCISQEQIDLAGKTAESVEGVTSVANRLSVKTPS
jgi:osmotically-inducible protein OsmY